VTRGRPAAQLDDIAGRLGRVNAHDAAALAALYSDTAVPMPEQAHGERKAAIKDG
jgi:hypothetical protein